MIKPQTTTTHEKVAALPDEWHVDCPDCGECLDVVLGEQNDGSWRADPSEAFVQCDCGKLIEVTGTWKNTQ